MKADKDFEMKREAQERKFHRIAKVYYFLEILQGSQNQCATQKKSPAHNTPMTTEDYILITEEIVRTS
jgi:hypothetical protein